MSATSSSTPAPVAIYLRRRGAGWQRGETAGRGERGHVDIQFGAEVISLRLRDLGAHGIERALAGGLLDYLTRSPEHFSAEWQEDRVSALVNVIAGCGRPVTLVELESDLRRSGLAGTNDPIERAQLLDRLSESDAIRLEQVDGQAVLAPAAPPHRDDPLATFLEVGEGSAAAKSALEQLTESRRAAEVLQKAKEALQRSERASHVLRRVKELVPASSPLARQLATPIADLCRELISDDVDEGERLSTAQAGISLLFGWLSHDDNRGQTAQCLPAIRELLAAPQRSGAFSPKGPRVSLMALLIESGMEDTLCMPEMWRALKFDELVVLLDGSKVARLLRQEPLLTEVTARVTSDLLDSDITWAGKLGCLLTAPNPIPELVTIDRFERLLDRNADQPTNFGSALRRWKDSAVGSARQEATDEAMTHLSRVETELTTQLMSTQRRVQELEDVQARLERDLRDERLKELHRGEESHQRAIAEARHTQRDVYRSLGRVLSDLHPLAETSDAARTLLRTSEAKAAEIGLLARGTPGDAVPFDPREHEMHGGVPGTPAVLRVPAYVLDGAPEQTVVVKAKVEAAKR